VLLATQLAEINPLPAQVFLDMSKKRPPKPMSASRLSVSRVVAMARHGARALSASHGKMGEGQE
jgi:hypothetical protein